MKDLDTVVSEFVYVLAYLEVKYKIVELVLCSSSIVLIRIKYICNNEL